MRDTYPFSAIVGQERMKRGLVLNAINSQIGGVLIRGERGTAKSTAARALAALLPNIEVVQGCRFGCEPNRPDLACDECRERLDRDGRLDGEFRVTPFVDLPVSATEDRVVGTLDIEKAIQMGERHFEPGILAAANRGIHSMCGLRRRIPLFVSASHGHSVQLCRIDAMCRRVREQLRDSSGEGHSRQPP